MGFHATDRDVPHLKRPKCRPLLEELRRGTKVEHRAANEIERLLEEVELWKSRYEAAEQAMRATEHHCEELLRERGYFGG